MRPLALECLDLLRFAFLNLLGVDGPYVYILEGLVNVLVCTLLISHVQLDVSSFQLFVDFDLDPVDSAAAFQVEVHVTWQLLERFVLLTQVQPPSIVVRPICGLLTRC